MQIDWVDTEFKNYQVSSCGLVRSKDHRVRFVHPVSKKEYYRDVKGRLLKQSIVNGGYKVVGLGSNGVFLVHRLVAKAFLYNEMNNDIINHKDENPENNNVDNLEWCSYLYNNNYGNAINKRTKAVIQKCISGKIIKIWSSTAEAAGILDLNYKSIHRCCIGKRKTYNNYKWDFI